MLSTLFLYKYFSSRIALIFECEHQQQPKFTNCCLFRSVLSSLAFTDHVPLVPMEIHWFHLVPEEDLKKK